MFNVIARVLQSRAALLAGMTLGLAGAAAATTYTVTDTADSATDTGSIRYAVDNAVSGDTINVTGTTGTITLTGGALTITAQNLTITGGAGTILSGGGAGSVFIFADGSSANVTGLTITGGSADEGGGIYNDGTLTLQNCVLSGNTALNGGGLYNDIDGSLTLTGCTVSGNTARGGDGAAGVSGGGGGGGAAGLGGGLFNSNLATLTACTFSGNAATGGNGGTGTALSGGSEMGGPGGAGGETVFGGMMPTGGQGGSADTGVGGGPFSGGGGGAAGSPGGDGSEGGGDGGTASAASGGGGGGGAGLGGAIFSYGYLAYVSLTLTDCTLSGNTARGGAGGNAAAGGAGEGGGLFCDEGGVALVNCTLAANTVAGGSGSGNTGTAAGGAVYNLFDDDNDQNIVTLINTLLAGTTGGTDYSESGDDSLGMTTDNGTNNLIQTNDAGSAGFGGGSLAAAPKLGALNGNGGPTQTQALGAGSPALAAGTAGPVTVTDPASDPSTGNGTTASASYAVPATDQRGLSRPVGVAPDIGAYQSQLTAIGDAYHVTSAVPSAVTAAGGVLANDSDPYGSPKAVLVSQASHGTVTLNGDGSFRYAFTGGAGFFSAANGYAGTDHFTYQLQDANGATGGTAAVTLTVSDTTPPATTATANPASPNGTNGWYTRSVQVTLAATDPNGLSTQTFYTLDGGTTRTYTVGSPIVASGDATHTVTYHSVDAAGNQETAQTLTLKIDSTPPTTTATTVTTPATLAAAASAQVTLTAADSLSGVAATFYTLDGGARQTYAAGTPISVTGAGGHTLTYSSVDAAGNAEAPHTLALTLAGPASVLHTFSPGLQMIAVPASYSGMSLASAWDAPVGQSLETWTGSPSYVVGTALPAPGQGAWVNLPATTHLYSGAAAVSTAAPFAIALSRGWNLVGDPFPGAVGLGSVNVIASGHTQTLSQASQANVVSGTLYTYPAGAGAYQAVGATGSLAPYQGYWVYAFQACTLSVPPPTGSAAVRSTTKH